MQRLQHSSDCDNSNCLGGCIGDINVVFLGFIPSGIKFYPKDEVPGDVPKEHHWCRDLHKDDKK